MSKTFDQGKDEVATLCRYFATNRQAFLAPGVKEAHVRQTLIDPFSRPWAGMCGITAWPRLNTGKSFPKTALTWKANRRPRTTPFALARCRSSTPKPKMRRKHRRRPRPGLPASPVRLERQACPVHSDQL